MDQLSGADSSLTIELIVGGALMAAIGGAIVWVIMHGRDRSVTPGDSPESRRGDKVDKP